MQTNAGAYGDDYRDDPGGYNLEHRSDLEQCSQSKEITERDDGLEIRLREHKEVKLEEEKSKETSRLATYDDIIALLDAEFKGLEEIPVSREVVVEDTSRLESMREFVVGGERRTESTVTDERRRERTLEGPEMRHEVTADTRTTVIIPPPEPFARSRSKSPSVKLQMRRTDKELETESDEEQLSNDNDQEVWVHRTYSGGGHAGEGSPDLVKTQAHYIEYDIRST